MKVSRKTHKVPRVLAELLGTRESEFCIWRTKGDSKVRTDHLAREGKIYRKDDVINLPGKDNNRSGDYGCRCYQEELPNNIYYRTGKWI